MATYITFKQGFGTMTVSLAEIYREIDSLPIWQQQSIALALSKAYNNNAMALSWALARDAAEQFGGSAVEYQRGGTLRMAQQILKKTTKRYKNVIKWRRLSTYMLSRISQDVIDYIDSNFQNGGSDAGAMVLVGRMMSELQSKRLRTGEAAIDTGAYVYVYDRLSIHDLIKDPAEFFQSDGTYRVTIELDIYGRRFKGFGDSNEPRSEKTTYGFKVISDKIDELINEYLMDREEYDEELRYKYNVPSEYVEY